MKRKIVKKSYGFTAKLLCALMALLLCSCQGGGGVEELTSGSPIVDSTTVMEAIASYTVVLPEQATEGERTAMQTLLAAFGDKTKRPQSDFVLRGEEIPSGNREILVGKTNRASSVAAVNALEHDRDFTVAFEEGEVIIAAKTDAAIVDAVLYFIEEVLPAPAAEHQPGVTQTVLYDYPLDSFFGMNLTYLKIGYEDEALQGASDALWNYINDSTGVHAEFDTHGGGNIRLVIDPELSNCDYKVEPHGTTITISAISPYAMNEAIRVIAAEKKGSEALVFSGKGEIPLSMLSIHDDRKMMLVWNDEFDGDTLDADKWQLKDRMWNSVVDTSDHSEKHIKLENGSVVMNTYRADPADPEHLYTTHGTLTTMDIMCFQYGYLEISARLPYDEGVWPAFWMQSAEDYRTVDYMTEIDVFELYKDDYMEGTMHKWYLNANGAAEKHDWNDPKVIKFSQVLDNFNRETFAQEYHTYGFGWTPTRIYFTVDNKIAGIYDITEAGDFGAGLGNPGEMGTLTGMGGFQNPVFINFTNWIHTSSEYKNSWTANDNSEFPFTFAIDYIRLYQVPGEGAIYFEK